MRPDVAEADRRQEVREAARAWHRHGTIGANTLAAIEATYADDRRRLGPVFRVLVFGFTVLAVSALFGLFALAGRTDRGTASLLTVWGLMLVAATELQIGAGRRRQGGTEAATAFVGVTHLLLGVAWLLTDALELRGLGAFTAALAVTVVFCGLAAWRWGYTAFAVAACAAAFGLAARTEAGRVLWIMVGAGVALLFGLMAESPRLAPAHRRACRAMAIVALAFSYFGVHIGSWDAQAVEELSGRHGGSGRDRAVLRALAAVATAAVPLLTLTWGIVRRRRWLIATGVAGVVASLVTLRAYVHVAPLWVVLIASGACCLALAAALRRYLESGPERERRGLTADPLFEEGESQGPLELAVGAVTLTPEARPPDAPPALQPGGGRYGGGGASGSY